MKNNFKIIAIKAHTNCNDEFSKVLKKNELYYFYSDYEIIKEKKGERIEIKNSYPDSLYNIQGFENEINVNIGAIVGRNGSGKSSIVELLFRAINNIGCNFLYTKNNSKKTITAKLKAVKGTHITFYYKTDWYYKITINNTNVEVFKFKENLTLDNECIINDFYLENFFYTEAVNYSHYAYNSREFAYLDNKKSIDWLKELFHKNDSYQTPLVLNPMRTEGNFDINRENDLVKQRLLANLLRPANGNLNFRNLGDNLVAEDIELTLKDKKEYYSHWITDKGGEPKERKIYLNKYTRQHRRKIISKIFESIMDIEKFDTNILDQKIYSYAEMYINLSSG